MPPVDNAMAPAPQTTGSAPACPAEQARTARWAALAIACFVLAALSWSASVGLQGRLQSAAQRRHVEWIVRQHSLEAIVIDVAREAAVAARSLPLDQLNGLSAQLDARVRDEPGRVVWIIDAAGRRLGTSALISGGDGGDAVRGGMTGTGTLPLLSVPVTDREGRIVARVQGALREEVPAGAARGDASAPPNARRSVAQALRDGAIDWPVLWFGAAMAMLAVAAGRYAWRAGPFARDAAMSRATEALLRADYRIVWRARSPGFAPEAAIDATTTGRGVDRARVTARAVRAVAAHHQALQASAAMLDRTETDAAAMARRGVDVAFAVGAACYPDSSPAQRFVLDVPAQTRCFSLLCGTGAGSLACLLAVAVPTAHVPWYGPVGLVAGWALDRLWRRDAMAMAASAADAASAVRRNDANARDVRVPGIEASWTALHIGLAVLLVIAVRTWPVLSAGPGVVLPAALAVMTGRALRRAVCCAGVAYDAGSGTGARGVGAAVAATERDGDGDDQHPRPDRQDGRIGFTGVALHRGGRRAWSCTVPAAIGVTCVGPGLPWALATGWPFAIVVVCIACVPLAAAILAWRWQAAAGPWQPAPGGAA